MPLTDFANDAKPVLVNVWLDKTEGVNGMYAANDGRLLGAQAFGHRVVSYAIGDAGPADTRVLLHDTKLHQPNDVAQSPNGDVYFTDPDFKDGATSAVYVITANGALKRIIEDMRIPNGLKVSNDGRTLYVADTNNHRIQVVDMKTKAVATLNLQGVEAPRRK